MRSERDGDRSPGSHSRHPETTPKPEATPKSPRPRGSASPALPVQSFKSVLGVSHHPKGVICCRQHLSSSREGTSRGEQDRRLTAPKCTGGFRSGQSLGSFLAAGICCNPISP